MHTRYQRVRIALERRTVAGGWRSHLFELLLFGFKQGWACLFGALPNQRPGRGAGAVTKLVA